MATGGGMKEFAIAQLGDCLDGPESCNADKVIRMTVDGYPMFKRVGVPGRDEELMRSVPLYMSACDFEKMKKMPLYFLTRDIGLTYLFYKIDYLELQSYGYMIQANAGKTVAIRMDRFSDCKFGLGPKWTRLNKTEQELEITLMRAAVESSRHGRELGHSRFRCRKKKHPIDATQYKPGSKILAMIKADTVMRRNSMGHGLAMMSDPEYNQKKLVSGSEPDTYVLYLTPGRDEVIEIKLSDLEWLIPDSIQYRANEHYGLAYLFWYLSNIGLDEVPRECNFYYENLADTEQQISRTVVEVEVACYDENKGVYNFNLLLGGGARLQIPLSAAAYEALQDMEEEIVEESLVQLRKEGIVHWSETATSPGPNIAKPRRQQQAGVSFSTQVRDDEPDVTEYRHESEQHYVQSEIIRHSKTEEEYFNTARVSLGRKNCYELLVVLKNQIEEQDRVQNDADRLKEVTERHFEQLKIKGREHNQKHLDLVIKQSERYPGCSEELCALKTAKERDNSYMTIEDASRLWVETEKLLEKAELRENREVAKGMVAAGAKLKAARAVFRREGIPAITLLRDSQVKYHIDGRCDSAPCQH